MNIIRKCPHCGSIWVCWNWLLAYGGDRKRFEKANPHKDPKDLMDWSHECWACENAIQTYNKVKNGIPYWALTKIYGTWKNLTGQYKLNI